MTNASPLQIALDDAQSAHDQAVAAAQRAASAVQSAELDVNVAPEQFEALTATARAADRSAKISAKQLDAAQRNLDAALVEEAAQELARLEGEGSWPATKARFASLLTDYMGALESVRAFAQLLHANIVSDEQRVARARELSARVGRPTTCTAPTIAQRRALALEVASGFAPVDLSWAAIEPDATRRAALVMQAFGAGPARSVTNVEHARLLLETGDCSVVLGLEAAELAKQVDEYDRASRAQAARDFERRNHPRYEHEPRPLGN